MTKNIIEKNRKLNSKKEKKDLKKMLLIILAILIALVIVLIPLLIYSEVKQVLPIVFFLVIPVIFGIVILLLSRNCLNDYNKKRERIIKMIKNV